MTTKLEKYVRLRLESPRIGHREASRLVGYKGCAPAAAVRAYRVARAAQKEPDSEAWLVAELARIEARIEREARRAALVRSKLRAVRVTTQKRVVT